MSIEQRNRITELERRVASLEGCHALDVLSLIDLKARLDKLQEEAVARETLKVRRG